MTREWSDEDLAKVLAAVTAEATPEPLARALARLDAERLPAWCAWTTRPWALAAAAGLLAVSLAGGVWLANTGAIGAAPSATASTTAERDPVALLLGDEDANVAGVASDSGAMR
jgi:hypothetical protein